MWRDDNTLTPLHLAAYVAKDEVVSLLLDRGADIESKDFRNDETALHVCARYNFSKVATVLIKRGAQVDARAKGQNLSNFTPLHYATMIGHPDVARILLESKADVNARDSQDGTPLHHAVRSGRKDVVSLLLEFNADTSLKEGQRTAAQISDEFGFKEIGNLIRAKKRP